jgi:hypothetical protein
LTLHLLGKIFVVVLNTKLEVAWKLWRRYEKDKHEKQKQVVKGRS